LVAAYSFNEGAGSTVGDASGTGNAGTINGATWTTAGRFGNALSFNGTSSFVTVPDSPALRLTAGVTLEAWVNPSTVTPAWRPVIFKGDLDYWMQPTTAGGPPNGGVTIAGGSWHDTYATSVLPINTWTHLALTYDGSALRLYVNGSQVSSSSVTGTIRTSSNPLEIGADTIFYSHYFAGLIDEIRVYNRALSLAEIQNDMNTPLAGGASSDTTAPTVSLTAPASGATVTGTVSVTASASDNVAVAGVQFLLDGANLGSEVTGPGPYSFSWNTTSASNGSHTLSARARDAAGNTTTSASRTVTVSNDTTAPTVSISSPAAGATVSGSVTITASASDNVAMAGVQFRLDGANLGAEVTGSGPTYTYTWNTTTASNGSHTLTARARDAAGNLTTSAGRTITVSNGTITPKTATLTWVASTTPGVSYNVYRGTTSGGPYTKLNASPITGLTYVDSTVQSGQTYYFVVRAVNSSGTESVNSNQATAVVP
jgi:hypothetical protein